MVSKQLPVFEKGQIVAYDCGRSLCDIANKLNRIHLSNECHGNRKRKTTAILVSSIPKLLRIFSSNNTGLQRNWGKHKNTHFYLIWGCWIQIWNLFLLITSSSFYIHSVQFVHIHKGVYEFRVNPNVVRLMAYFLVIMHWM